MKTRGISFRTKEYKGVKFSSGVANIQRPNSFYIEMSTKISSTNENYMRTVKSLFHNMRQSLKKNLDTTKLREEFISIQNIPDSFIETGKTFMVYEFTLFPKDKVEVNEMRRWVTKYTDAIYQAVENNTDFIFETNRDRWKKNNIL
jgi:hypothetical protein